MKKTFLYFAFILVSILIAKGVLMAQSKEKIFECATSLEKCFATLPKEGKVKIQGKVSDIIMAHLVGPPDGYPIVTYIDIPKQGQIVAYSKEPIVGGVDGYVNLIGTLIKRESKGKGTKAGEEGYTEYQLIVECAEALHPGAIFIPEVSEKEKCHFTLTLRGGEEPKKVVGNVAEKSFKNLKIVDGTSLTTDATIEIGQLIKRPKKSYRDVFLFFVQSHTIKTFVHAEATLCMTEEIEDAKNYIAVVDGEHTYFTNQMNKQTYRFEFSIDKKSGRIFIRGID